MHMLFTFIERISVGPCVSLVLCVCHYVWNALARARLRKNQITYDRRLMAPFCPKSLWSSWCSSSAQRCTLSFSISREKRGETRALEAHNRRCADPPRVRERESGCLFVSEPVPMPSTRVSVSWCVWCSRFFAFITHIAQRFLRSMAERTIFIYHRLFIESSWLVNRGSGKSVSTTLVDRPLVNPVRKMCTTR